MIPCPELPSLSLSLSLVFSFEQRPMLLPLFKGLFSAPEAFFRSNSRDSHRFLRLEPEHTHKRGIYLYNK